MKGNTSMKSQTWARALTNNLFLPFYLFLCPRCGKTADSADFAAKREDTFAPLAVAFDRCSGLFRHAQQWNSWVGNNRRAKRPRFNEAIRRKSSTCVLLPAISNCFFSVCESTRWRARAHREAAILRDLFPACVAHGEARISRAGNAAPDREIPCLFFTCTRLYASSLRWCYKFSVSALYVQTCALQRILLSAVCETQFANFSSRMRIYIAG